MKKIIWWALLLAALGCTGCSFDLFYVEVEVVPIPPVVIASAGPSVQAATQPRSFAEAVKTFLTLYPFKKGRLAAIEANKVNGFGVKYVKRWGLFKLTTSPRSATHETLVSE